MSINELRSRIVTLEHNQHKMEKQIMTIFDDVKAAADKATAADTAVLAAVAALKSTVASLQAQIAALPPAPSPTDLQNLQASVDELNKGTDAVTAAIS